MTLIENGLIDLKSAIFAKRLMQCLKSRHKKTKIIKNAEKIKTFKNTLYRFSLPSEHHASFCVLDYLKQGKKNGAVQKDCYKKYKL